jgi:hypothetical protein
MGFPRTKTKITQRKDLKKTESQKSLPPGGDMYNLIHNIISKQKFDHQNNKK